MTKWVKNPESSQRTGSSAVRSQAVVRGTWAPAELVELNVNEGRDKAQGRDQSHSSAFHLPGEFKKKKKKCVYIYIPEPAVAAGPVCLSCMSVLGLPRPFSPVFFLWLGYFISLRWEDKRHWRRMDHQPATSFLQLSYKCKLWVWVQGSPLKTGRCWIPKLHMCCWSVFSKPTVVC